MRRAGETADLSRSMENRGKTAPGSKRKTHSQTRPCAAKNKTHGQSRSCVTNTSRFGFGNGDSQGAAYLVSDLSRCLFRRGHHSDRLAGHLTPFRRRFRGKPARCPVIHLSQKSVPHKPPKCKRFLFLSAFFAAVPRPSVGKRLRPPTFPPPRSSYGLTFDRLYSTIEKTAVPKSSVPMGRLLRKRDILRKFGGKDGFHRGGSLSVLL